MSRMLEVRQTLLEKEKEFLTAASDEGKGDSQGDVRRVKSIRDEVTEILDKLTDRTTNSVRPDLLRLKLKIENEMLRLSSGDSGEAEEGCEECEVLMFVLNKLKTLLLCDSPITDIDLPEAGSQVVIRPRLGSCDQDALVRAREEFSVIVEMLDIKITTTYLNVFLDQTDQIQSLDIYKELKVDIEDVFTQSMIVSFDVLETDIRKIIYKVESLLSKCKSDCQLTRKCDGCIGTLLTDWIGKLQSSVNKLETGAEKSSVRKILIGIIDENNKMERDIVVWKATNQTLDDCDEERLEALRSVKEPLWMVVNISLQYSGTGELNTSLTTIMELLTDKRTVHCQQSISCESQERKTLQTVLKKLDHLIESAFFKSKSEPGKLERNLTIGMIDILNILEIRVQNIFEEKLRCMEEIKMIKKYYM